MALRFELTEDNLKVKGEGKPVGLSPQCDTNLALETIKFGESTPIILHSL